AIAPIPSCGRPRWIRSRLADRPSIEPALFLLPLREKVARTQSASDEGSASTTAEGACGDKPLTRIASQSDLSRKGRGAPSVRHQPNLISKLANARSAAARRAALRLDRVSAASA